MWNKEEEGLYVHAHSSFTNKAVKLLKKTTIPAVIGLGIMASVVQADSELSTIYHVYVDESHVGTIDDKEIVHSYVDEMLEEHEQANDDQELSYTVGEEITYVSERVFEPSAVNQKVVNELEDQLSIKVNAYEVKIGDKVLGYFSDKDIAEETLNNFKSKYVDLDVLENLEKGHIAENVSLSVGDTTIVDVELSEKVSFSQKKVDEKEILTEEQGMTILEKGTLTDKIHKVEEGEVLGRIASDYNLDLDTVLEMNPSLKEDSLLQIGQEINVTDYAPFLDVIVKQEELVEEEIAYDKEVEYSDELYKGDTRVKQSGQKGTKKVHYELEKVNGTVVSKDVLDSEVTKEPVKEVIVHGTKVISSRGTGEFKWPTVGGRITSYQGQRWGRLHKGIDIAGVSNRTIMAADNGVVTFAGYDGSFGNKVVINHNNGYKTIYAHMSSISVNVGQTVVKGKKLGVMGSTGRSTGTHLHFEVYKNGVLKNPLDLF